MGAPRTVDASYRDVEATLKRDRLAQCARCGTRLSRSAYSRARRRGTRCVCLACVRSAPLEGACDGCRGPISGRTLRRARADGRAHVYCRDCARLATARVLEAPLRHEAAAWCVDCGQALRPTSKLAAGAPRRCRPCAMRRAWARAEYRAARAIGFWRGREKAAARRSAP